MFEVFVKNDVSAVFVNPFPRLQGMQLRLARFVGYWNQSEHSWNLSVVRQATSPKRCNFCGLFRSKTSMTSKNEKFMKTTPFKVLDLVFVGFLGFQITCSRLRSSERQLRNKKKKLKQ